MDTLFFKSAAHTGAVSAVPYHSDPMLYLGPSNVEWIDVDTSDDDDSSMTHFTDPRDTSFLETDTVPNETRHFAEWLDPYDAEDDVPDSMIASCSSASVWSYSGVASTASTSVDSLGLHHVTTFGMTDDCSADVLHSPTQTIYDRTDFAIASQSICSHHELSELDITLIPPSSGTLVNWKSPMAPCCAMEDDDDIMRLLGQKRPRDTELDELADRYKRRRMLELQV